MRERALPFRKNSRGGAEIAKKKKTLALPASWRGKQSLFIGLSKCDLFDKLFDMKTVTLRSLRRDTRLLDSVAEGQEILVTRFGKPYVRLLPADQPRCFVGAGKHLRVKKPVLPDPIPASEWKGTW